MNLEAKVCRHCGTTLVSGQAFCPGCGKPVDIDDSPTYYRSEPALIPPPPPDFSNSNPSTPSKMDSTNSPYQSSSSPSGSGPARPQFPQMQPASSWARSPQRAGKRRVGMILLLVLLILGVAGYFTWNTLMARGRTISGTTSPSSGTDTTHGVSTPSYGATDIPMDMKVIPLNKSVTYADDTLTLLDAKQAKGFSDEKTPGDMLRLDVKEQTGDKAPYFGTYGYTSSFHVILPNGESVELANIQAADTTVGSPPAQVARTNWLDFPVPVTTPLTQITLRLGNPNEHQIEFPLTQSADVSTYQPRTVTVNKPLQWGGLNWTLTTAARQLSAQGNQAEKDMIYVVLSFKVDSTSTNGYLDQAVGDAFRLRADGTTLVAPKYTTFPETIAVGETGKTGTVGFLVPQKSATYTLLLPVYDRGGITSTTQVTTDFQIQ
ncbi:zinc ribbon domain-containing protein [Ktedonosporobacter rubrisoli]|uniref:Zinc ribbon domain-containing protein n=1 Tax=Ktedonosporobacter rubrisoli TaxID=2509675 RepID=A0A4P6JI19_KTERU|nr:zinc ribbon domain-containing protein [Ktedonosporobacter rubrisoli]QBD74697.1 zinc ribbon domain-containing protein [Ktedonosporobacter rubrisoli]